MMIRINLLPVRAVKKREMGQQLMVLFAVVLVGAGVFNYLWLSSREAEQARNAARIAQTNLKLAELEKVIGEVKNINARKAEVERKLAVLDDLRKGRSGPVRRMDALASATPKKVWLKTFAEENNNVKLTATAASHDDVAEYMRSLTNVVWTPKGLGRLLEQRRDSNIGRVELLSGDAAVEEFPSADIKPFFTQIELGAAQQTADKGATLVDFNLTLAASYAL